MYPGKADEWLYLERGVGAFYYTMFQRTIATLTAMYASHDIYNTACKRCCLSVIIKISSIQYFHRLLHLPCLLHVQQGRDPQVGNPLNFCVMLVAVQPDPEDCGGQPGRGLAGCLVPRLCLCLLVVGASLPTFLFCHQPMAGALPAGDADETGGEADRPRLHLQLHPHLALAQRGGGGVALLTRSFLQRSIRCAPTWQTSIRPVAL